MSKGTFCPPCMLPLIYHVRRHLNGLVFRGGEHNLVLNYTAANRLPDLGYKDEDGQSKPR